MDKQLASALLEKMMLTRKFEESVQYYFTLGMIHGTTHLGIGEEATAAGTCLALDKGDALFATHRGHGAAICKGADIRRMMAEIFGKEAGLCRGRGGSMHLADISCGAMGSNGIVGPSAALAAGAALARKMRGENTIACAFFGDGALNEGVVHEALNLAAVWELPVLFVCTNNLYGMSTHISRVMKNTDIASHAAAYGMEAETVDGNDAEAVYDAACRARARILEAKAPFLLVENTYRISGHSKSDGNQYRSKEEIRYWKGKDPIRRHGEKVLELGLADQEEIDEMDRKTTEIIEDAVQFAIAAPFPKVEDIYEDVYAK